MLCRVENVTECLYFVLCRVENVTECLYFVLCRVENVTECLCELVTDDSKNGAVLAISKAQGKTYISFPDVVTSQE